MKRNMQAVLISVLTLVLLVSAGCASKGSQTASEAPAVSAAASDTDGTQPDISHSTGPEEIVSPDATVSAEPSASEQPIVKPSSEPSPMPSDNPKVGKNYDELGAALLENDGLGALKLRMSESELIKLLGEPDSRTDPEVWGADGLEHSDWVYDTKGLYIGMAKQPDDTEAFIFSLTASTPCDLATKRGVKIGDPKDAVLSAYKNEIDPAANDDTDSWIVIGSAYGGIGIGIENGVVTSIFIGASAE